MAVSDRFDMSQAGLIREKTLQIARWHVTFAKTQTFCCDTFNN